MRLNGMIIAGIGLIAFVLLMPILLATVTYSVAKPTGNFYINGELASATSTHEVTAPTLNFNFVALAHGDLITDVVLSLYDETGLQKIRWEGSTESYIKLNEDVADTEWTGSGTLPAAGTYVIHGTVDTTSGESIIVMSVTGTWTGSTGLFKGFVEKQLDILQIGLGIAGVGLVVLGLRKKW